MTRVMQTKLAGHRLHCGNCLAACLASIVEWPLWAVPAFEETRREHSMHALAWQWLDLIGYNFEVIDGDVVPLPSEPYIASGMSPRGVQHAVVYIDGALVHDPHPLGGGIVSVDRVYRIGRRP